MLSPEADRSGHHPIAFLAASFSAPNMVLPSEPQTCRFLSTAAELLRADTAR